MHANKIKNLSKKILLDTGEIEMQDTLYERKKSSAVTPHSLN